MDSKVNVKESYISIGCNRKPLCLDWGFNGLVAFAACNYVALYEPQHNGCGAKIKCLLYAHRDNVNCVKWISKEKQGVEEELVSGAIDGTAIIWRYCESNWSQYDTLTGQNGAIMAIAAITITNLNDIQTIVATAAPDSTVKIWERNNFEGKFVCIETLDLNGGFALCLELSTLPTTKAFVLACGNEDSKVSLYTKVNSKFACVLQLTGHEDWVQAVNFIDMDCGDVLLASSSQDCSIRIWRISKEETRNTESNTNEDLVLTSNKFAATWQDCSSDFSVILETILVGHEGWIYGICWHPKILQDGKTHQPLCLMSSSMDKTIVVWKLDEQSGMWIDEYRVGDVGGNTLGFYGGCFSPDGDQILAYSYQGALHMWKKQTDRTRVHTWEAVFTPSGHFGAVQDISWEPKNGEFLVSLSSDQTTRIHAPWRREGYKTTWHEIGRPQIHGYNMQCLVMISRYCFASAADEKVIRVFEAPKSFAQQFTSLCQVQDVNGDYCKSLGASVPVLGLSNKAVFDGDLENLKTDLEDPQRPMKASAFASEEPAPFTPFKSEEPPVESNLLQNTLWPETQKLYGHGYEIFSLAYNDKSNILASSSKASKADHANILLWDTISWKIIGSLEGHALTITQMEFSPSGKYLLSVSRDRTWCLFEQTSNEEKALYKLAAKIDKKLKAHSRVIWSCSWTSDESFFFTASRDKKVVSWRMLDKSREWLPAGNALDVGEPVTAVAVSSRVLSNSRYFVSVGTESGKIYLYIWSVQSGWLTLTTPQAIMCHTSTIKRLKWKPSTKDEESNKLYLASCAEDNCIRIYEIENNSS